MPPGQGCRFDKSMRICQFCSTTYKQDVVEWCAVSYEEGEVITEVQLYARNKLYWAGQSSRQAGDHFDIALERCTIFSVKTPDVCTRSANEKTPSS